MYNTICNDNYILQKSQYIQFFIKYMVAINTSQLLYYVDTIMTIASECSANEILKYRAQLNINVLRAAVK